MMIKKSQNDPALVNQVMAFWVTLRLAAKMHVYSLVVVGIIGSDRQEENSLLPIQLDSLACTENHNNPSPLVAIRRDVW